METEVELGLVKNESGHPTEWVSPSQVALQGTIKSPIKGPAPKGPVHLPAVSARAQLPLVKWVSPSQWDHVLLYDSFSSCSRRSVGRGGSMCQKGSVAYSDVKFPLTPCHLIAEAITQMETWLFSQGSEFYKFVCTSGGGGCHVSL